MHCFIPFIPMQTTMSTLLSLLINVSIFSARSAISCQVIAQLAKDYAENSSYVKDLPALVLRELSRALVIAGSAIEHDLSRKQYLSQVRIYRNVSRIWY